MKDGSVRDHYEDGYGWNANLRRTLFRESERTQLDSLMGMLGNVSLNEEEDEWEWVLEKSNVFSVKSCYEFLEKEVYIRESGNVQFPWKRIWEDKIPTNVKFFKWTFHWDRLLTVDRLQKLGLIMPNRCGLCKEAEENGDHIFLNCRFTRRVWEELVTVKADTRYTLNNCTKAKEFMLEWKDFNSKDLAFYVWAILPSAVLWVLWKLRNEVIFNDGQVVFEETMTVIKATIWSWLEMNTRAMEYRKAFKFTDMLYGWRLIMCEQW
ncbi:hypothetical protein FRX31_031732 [Thalictrum thalictroides]|uniref:Reverse transcriptase zinc-binding domain-containing protein n=1 Tax=Thalictrum thalictroides TaxID=46969 RepID=A0A7J6V1L3_THATH|nr:hypothetical protein FRX31_031732 [Thalictrum thalictroides]